MLIFREKKTIFASTQRYQREQGIFWYANTYLHVSSIICLARLELFCQGHVELWQIRLLVTEVYFVIKISSVSSYSIHLNCRNFEVSGGERRHADRARLSLNTRKWLDLVELAMREVRQCPLSISNI